MFHHQTRRGWMKTALVAAAGAAGLGRPVSAAESPQPAPGGETPIFPFYAMDTALRGPDVPTIESKVALLKKLGYTGIDFTLSGQLPKMLDQLGQHGLELWAVYLSPSLEGGLPANMEDSVRLMKGRRTRIELAIGSKEFKPSDAAGDARAVEMLKRASDIAADTGPVVSVYPHRGAWTERVDDGVRLARQIGRKNVGTNFNLVHWKWLPQTKSLETLLTEALPHLMTVTINGMAGAKIAPLDEGDYDVTEFMATVKKVGYRGPVGFQGFGIKGNSEEILSRTMKKWREIVAKISA